jgi:hypothetical protein
MATKKSRWVHDSFFHEPQLKGTEFPIYKKVVTLDKNGDAKEHFEPMTVEDVKCRRLGSPFVDVGNGKFEPPIDYDDKFEKFDTLNDAIDNINPDDFKDEK